MSMLVNKLATAVLIRADKQYSCQIKNIDFKTENLIQVLSLQAIIQLKIRLTADNLESYKKTSSLNQKTVSSSISVSLETVFLSIFINESASYNNLDVRKKKSSIFNLIKNAQDFDLLF